MDKIFDDIYIKKIWNSNADSIPLSGPGSDMNITKELRDYLNRLKGFSSCLDIGCGDLPWIRDTNIFNDKYIGIDISNYIINQNMKLYPNKKFLCINAIDGKLFDADLFICRDVMFHLNKDDNIKLLRNIGKYKFKYIIFTSCFCAKNIFNVNNQDHFCQINLEMSPFNFKNFTYSIEEKKFNRKIIVISYDNYINNLKNIN